MGKRITPGTLWGVDVYAGFKKRRMLRFSIN
jgi:hypothetical protein